MTKGAAPCAVKVACTVLNGGDEETYPHRERALSLPNMGFITGVNASGGEKPEIPTGEEKGRHVSAPHP